MDSLSHQHGSLWWTLLLSLNMAEARQPPSHIHWHESRGSSTRFVKISNGPNTISEWSNLLYSLTRWYPESLKKKLTITCPLGVSNVKSVFLVGVIMGFCWFLTSFEFLCPSMIVLLHIIWSICICHWYTDVTDYYASHTDCRHLNNDTIWALHLAVIRCAGLAFTCGVKMMWLCHGWGWQPPQTASHIHIRNIQRDWAHCYAIHGHTVPALLSPTDPTWLRFWLPGSLVDEKWSY